MMNGRVGKHFLSLRKWLVLRAAVAVVLVSGNIYPAEAQAHAADGTLSTFDSATVKLSAATDKYEHLKIAPNQFDYSNVTVKKLIAFAYGINGYQVVNTPDWGDSARYDIEGRWKDTSAAGTTGVSTGGTAASSGPSGSSNDPKLKAMVQALLADRFHLKLKPEMRPMDVYDLVVASSGSKLSAAAAAAPLPEAHGAPVTSVSVKIGAGRGELHLNGPVSALAGFLSDQINQQVVDKTGIKGSYDMTLNWNSDQNATDSIGQALQDDWG